MIRAVSYIVSVLINISILFIVCGDLWGQSVNFDCPASEQGRIVAIEGDEKLIEVPIRVSSFVTDKKLLVESLQIDVNWNRDSFPVVDYAPQTELQARYDGPISVEKKSEANLGLGVKVSSSHFDFLAPALSTDVSKKNSETRRFDEIPEHDLLVASGTLNRGTGAYFQFRKSPTTTLEGSRELIIVFRVPLSWRGGVLQITFRTEGRLRKFGSFNDEFEFARVFVMPVYLEGDDQARQFANEFAQAEQQLRHKWGLYESESTSSLSQIQRLVSNNRQGQAIPSLWVHHLIQSGSDRAIEKYGKRLPTNVAAAANDFVRARRDLAALSR